MLKEILKSFLPWILFFALAGNSVTQFKIAILVAVFASIFFELKALRKKFILSWGTLIFYVGMLIIVFIFNIVWILKYTWLLANITLALIAWTSLIIKQPFTIQYAKEMVSPDKWKHPIFLRINNIITLVWAVSFTIGVLLNLLRMYEPTLNNWAFETLTYVPSVFAIAFTKWFPEWYKKQLVDSTSATKT